MWEFFGRVVDALPPWFLSVLIVFLLGLAAYVVPRLRRDKQGRWYIYSRQYEAAKQARKSGNAELQKKYETIISSLGENKKEILQLRICAKDLPLTAKREAYLEYKKLGHNSWIDGYVVDEGLFTAGEIKYIAGDAKAGKA